jgi:hypothetical protein
MHDWLTFCTGLLLGFGCAWGSVLVVFWPYRKHRLINMTKKRREILKF